MDDNHCKFIKDDGAQCGARKIRGSDYCFFHDPAKAAERASAREAGGRRGRAAVLPADTPSRPVKAAGDVVSLLSETINHVRTGALDPRVGNCIGYLSGIILKAVEQGHLEERLAALEGIVSGQSHSTGLFDTDPGELIVEGEDRTDPGKVPA